MAKDDPVDRQFRTERAKRAADARWAKARIEQRLWKIAEGYQAADPQLTREQAFAKAVQDHPSIYQEYVTASERMPSITYGEMEEDYQREVRDFCLLADQPEMADHFVRNRVAPRDVIAYLLERKRTSK